MVDIGLILSVSGLASLFGQAPGGVVVDAARSERVVAGTGISLIALAALIYALFPIFPAVLLAAILHAAGSCVLGPAIWAISLGLVGHGASSERFGRNARFASIGSGLSAAVMAAVGYYISPQWVFFVTAALLRPALLVLRGIPPAEIDPDRAHGNLPEEPHEPPRVSLKSLLRRHGLLVFGLCILLFHFANAAILPTLGSVLTMRVGKEAALLIGACIVGPQLLVALFSPWVGVRAQRWGRRPLLIAAFAVVPIRGFLLAVVRYPYLQVAVQLFDGLTAAVFSVMVPLIVADITRGTGRFNLAQGLMGTTMGIGASLSPTFAGYLSDSFGYPTAFLGLAGVALLGLLVVISLMPETRPELIRLRKRPSASGCRSSSS